MPFSAHSEFSESLSEERIRSTLAQVRYPGYSRDIVSFGLVKQIFIEEAKDTEEAQKATVGAHVRVALELTTRDSSVPALIQTEAEAVLKALPGVKAVTVSVTTRTPSSPTASSARSGSTGSTTTAGADPANPPLASTTPQGPTPIAGVKKVIAVASGKGGVGKSTVAVNLALALASLPADSSSARKLSVGLCDCDIYGPSVALMLGGRQQPYATADDRILPIRVAGIQAMSMGFLLEDAAPAVMRGPMVTRTTQQLLRQVLWGEPTEGDFSKNTDLENDAPNADLNKLSSENVQPLDYLILDLPPGTGDIQLTIVQTVELAGAVLVTTPQEVALLDVRKAAAMLGKVNVPLLGILENMSYFLCPDNGKRYDLFGTGGGAREAARLRIPLLGEIPIDIATREAGDRGVPIVQAAPENAVSKAFLDAAAQLHTVLSKLPALKPAPA